MTLNAIIANFQTFKLVDLLDIIIIAFLIYQLLGIVNRTRAGQLFKGALLVMAVYLVAETLNMRTVTWLLNSLLQVGLLTLVVLFQPEIRRALERMGQTDQWAAKLFNVKGRYNDPSLKGAWRSAIIAICDAAERFSETKTGALIVLERHTNLSEIVRTGTPVNSAVNLEVLGTIFYINGAVSPQRRQEIIDEFNNAKAGAVLPAQIQAGGTGLNIQSASVVIICEPQFKPSIENQAISRAYRMGQTRNVLASSCGEVETW